jgi:competence protein ComEC
LGARVLILASDRGWLGLLPGQRVETTGRLSLPDGGDLRAAIVSVLDAPAKVSPAPVVQRAAGALPAGLQRACWPLPAEPGELLPGLVGVDALGDVERGGRSGRAAS